MRASQQTAQYTCTTSKLTASENGNNNFHDFFFLFSSSFSFFYFVHIELVLSNTHWRPPHMCLAQLRWTKKMMWISAHHANLLNFRQSKGKEFFFFFFSSLLVVRRQIKLKSRNEYGLQGCWFVVKHNFFFYEFSAKPTNERTNEKHTHRKYCRGTCVFSNGKEKIKL